MRRRMTTLGCGAALVAALAGCTSAANGTPTAAPTPTGDPQPTSEPPATTSSEENAPRVEHPLDATKYLSQPCAVLTPTQLTSLSITTPGDPETTGAVAEHAGPACTWITEQPERGNYHVGFMTGNKNGLSDTYRGSWPGYFEPTRVSGYPAVFNDVVDSRDTGRCVLTVGISDNLTFLAQLTSKPGHDACGGAMQVAEMVVATIKAGG